MGEGGMTGVLTPDLFSGRTLKAAASLWLMHRAAKRSEGTIRQYEKHLKPLLFFFGDVPLIECADPVKIHNYQHWRQTAEGSSRGGAAAGLINHEVNVLQQILRKAGLWKNVADWYEPLPVPRHRRGTALEPEEEKHLIVVAGSNTRWKVAFCCAVLTANTTATGSELKYLRFCDLFLAGETPKIRVFEGVKNIGRERMIPLNADALWAVKSLHERALIILGQKGIEWQGDFFLLPHRGTKGSPWFDFTRPMNSWLKSWYRLRLQASQKYPRLAKLRYYDLRHHALTKLLENPNVSEQTIEDIAGHLSHEMKKQYSHIRMKARAEALDSINMGLSGNGHHNGNGHHR